MDFEMSRTILISILIFSCCDNLLPECSLLTGRAAYLGEIITDKSFEDITVARGDTVYIRPEYNVHGFNEYVGDEECREDGYEKRPDFYIRNVNSTLIDAKVIYDEKGDSRYDHPSEIKIQIIGKEVGSTSFTLKVVLSYPGYREDLETIQNYQINTDVIK